jgi:hypothetical protein
LINLCALHQISEDVQLENKMARAGEVGKEQGHGGAPAGRTAEKKRDAMPLRLIVRTTGIALTRLRLTFQIEPKAVNWRAPALLMPYRTLMFRLLEMRLPRCFPSKLGRLDLVI